MINVSLALADVLSAPGDRVVYTKEQAAQLLAEVDLGQRARIALTNLKTQAAIAAAKAGIAA